MNLENDLRTDSSDKSQENVYEIARRIGTELDRVASHEVLKFPKVLTPENKHLFIEAFDRIDRKVLDGQKEARSYGDDVLDCGADRMLVPFHRLTWEWANAYTNDFTWEAFIDDMLHSGAVNIEVHAKELHECGDSGSCVRVFFFNRETGSAGCVEFGFPD